MASKSKWSEKISLSVVVKAFAQFALVVVTTSSWNNLSLPFHFRQWRFFLLTQIVVVVRSRTGMCYVFSSEFHIFDITLDDNRHCVGRDIDKLSCTKEMVWKSVGPFLIRLLNIFHLLRFSFIYTSSFSVAFGEGFSEDSKCGWMNSLFIHVLGQPKWLLLSHLIICLHSVAIVRLPDINVGLWMGERAKEHCEQCVNLYINSITMFTLNWHMEIHVNDISVIHSLLSFLLPCSLVRFVPTYIGCCVVAYIANGREYDYFCEPFNIASSLFIPFLSDLYLAWSLNVAHMTHSTNHMPKRVSRLEWMCARGCHSAIDKMMSKDISCVHMWRERGKNLISSSIKNRKHSQWSARVGKERRGGKCHDIGILMKIVKRFEAFVFRSTISFFTFRALTLPFYQNARSFTTRKKSFFSFFAFHIFYPFA